MPSPLFNLTGRVALVTGGSKGLGKAMARGMAEAGADVVISSRHEDELRTAAAEIRHGLETGVATIVADMTKREDVRKLADTATHAFGKIDILINNAGSNTPQPHDAIQDKDWDEIIELNLTSCMALSRYLIPGMKQRHWGRIIYMSSIMGLSSYMGRGAYSATKSAVIGLCRASALELGEYGITVNCIAPGPILTDLPSRVLTEEVRNAVAARTAIGRWGDPRELAGPAVFLASEAGNYVTGSVVVVDGGILARVF
jgi:NAD(P)-dependent dehydrogenase (short-subunit alcohol dehydrogenase family)